VHIIVVPEGTAAVWYEPFSCVAPKKSMVRSRWSDQTVHRPDALLKVRYAQPHVCTEKRLRKYNDLDAF